jgi:hypothetical protein
VAGVDALGENPASWCGVLKASSVLSLQSSVTDD